MDHGVLQQVGTPLEVYNNPANVFVARFIGAPGMNLWRGEAVEGADGMRIDLGALGRSAPLDPPLAAAARTAGAKGVYFGFRPEQVELVSDGAGIGMTVGFVERIGARTILHLERDSITAKTVFENDEQVTAGDLVHVAPLAGALRLFDAASGAALRGL
jgi:multiple sugar transport system ATP-binding protein